MEKMITKLIEFLNSKEAERLVAVDVSGITTTAKYVFIMSANSQVHANSLAEHIKSFLLENDYGQYLMSKSIKTNNPWILIDASDLIFHVFQREEREFYNLEKLYFRGTILEGAI